MAETEKQQADLNSSTKSAPLPIPAKSSDYLTPLGKIRQKKIFIITLFLNVFFLFVFFVLLLF